MALNQLADVSCSSCRTGMRIRSTEDISNDGSSNSTSFISNSSNSHVVLIPALEMTLDYAQHTSTTHHNEPSSLEQVFVIKCTSCDKSVALHLNGKYYTKEDLLHDPSKPDGWVKVESQSDRLVLFILSQIIYREYEVPDEDELQVEYAFPPQTDIAKVLWIKGNAVGFYSAKPKGTLDLDTMEWYSMTVLDTIFIRTSHRRQGYASTAVQNMLQEFPDQNIGFSVPISIPMTKVLRKHLELHPGDRMKLWKVSGCGLEGNCQILWFSFKTKT